VRLLGIAFLGEPRDRGADTAHEGGLWLRAPLALLLLACIAPALVFLKLQPQWEKALQGCIILLAVAADGWRTVKAQTANLR